MYQAIPYMSSHNNNFGNINQNYYHNNNNKNENPKSSPKGEEKMKFLLNMVSENAVIVIGRKGCCMTHVVKRLLQSLSVNPMIHEVDEEKDEVFVARELEAKIIEGNEEEQRNCNVQFPMVFIGGKLFGGLDRVMATHISGELVPLLKQVGALWL